MKKYRNNLRFGITSGLSSGVLWGLDTVITGIILSMYPLSMIETIAIAPIVLSFLHDLSSAFCMMLIAIIRKDFVHIVSLFKTRSGKFVVLAAIFGGPIGMMSYMFAIENIGPGYTAAISAMYPAAGAFFGYLFLRDRLSIKGWIGLSMSIVSIIILGYGPGDMQGNNFVFGFFAALMTVVGWSLESVICSYGMKDDIMPIEALTIRQFTSSLIYLVIIVLFINGSKLSVDVITSKVMLCIIVTALIGTLSYIFYYSAIDSIGPVKATGLNITYSIWAILFSLLISGGNLSTKLIVCAILIIVGTTMVSRDQAKQ